jgi:hypothetical protein
MIWSTELVSVTFESYIVLDQHVILYFLSVSTVLIFVRFQVPTVISMKTPVFWDVQLCRAQHRLDDGGSKHLINVSFYQTTSQKTAIFILIFLFVIHLSFVAILCNFLRYDCHSLIQVSSLNSLNKYIPLYTSTPHEKFQLSKYFIFARLSLVWSTQIFSCFLQGTVSTLACYSYVTSNVNKSDEVCVCVSVSVCTLACAHACFHA